MNLCDITLPKNKLLHWYLYCSDSYIVYCGSNINYQIIMGTLMLKKTIHLFLLLILLTTTCTLAAPLSIGERLKLNSTYLNEEREIQDLKSTILL